MRQRFLGWQQEIDARAGFRLVKRFWRLWVDARNHQPLEIDLLLGIAERARASRSMLSLQTFSPITLVGLLALSLPRRHRFLGR